MRWRGIRVAEWCTVRLEDLCTRVTSGGTPKRSRLDYYAGESRGHPWVKSSELRDGYVRETDERISDLGLQKSAAKLLPPDTVLVAMYGATAGRVGLLTIGAAVNQAVCALVLDRDRADPVFVFHALRSQYVELAGKSAGAAQQNLNANIIKSFPLIAPGIATQRRIAAILSAFDELIEINERRIQLLEALARSLYREWFGHFRFPGHEDVEIVDSELGPIPTGWEVVSLAELVTTQYGFTASATTDNVGPQFLRGMDINKRSYIDWSQVPRCVIDGEQLEAFRLQVGDICVIRMADPGKVGIVETAIDGVFASYLVRLRSAEPRLPPYLLFHFLDSATYQDLIRGSSTGSTRKSASAGVLTEPLVALPTLEVATQFELLVGALRAQLTGLVEHSACLTATRDLLLPRLVTGRLDISDIDLGILTPGDVE